jgi:cyclomaltodextrinase / maltogenic alpha-amylase / neopullulanase
MEGQRDPDCRRPFPWNWDQDAKRTAMHEWYTKLANLRLAHAALRTGDFRTLAADGMNFVYSRKGGGEEFIVALNAGRPASEVSVDLAPWGGTVKVVDALTGATATWTGTAKLPLPGETGRVWQVVK